MYGEGAVIRGHVACRTPEAYPLGERLEAIPGDRVAAWCEPPGGAAGGLG